MGIIIVKQLFFFIIFLALLFPQNVFAADSPLINEAIVHPSSGNEEWVEIYNPAQEDLSNYWIDDDINFNDDAGSSNKKQLVGVGAAVYIVFTLSSAIFNNSGDHIVLFNQVGEVIDQYEYDSDPGVDISLGRSPNGEGQFNILAAATKGGENSAPLPAPTLTPTPSPSPLPTVKPTKEPTPTKAPTLSHSPSLGPTAKFIKLPTPVSRQDGSTKTEIMFSVNKEATHDAQPTAILGVSTSAVTTTLAKNNKQTLINSATKNNSLNGLFFIIGAVFLASCGILIFFRSKK